MFIDCETKLEAYYVAALLNSSPCVLVALSYTALTIVAHTLDNIRINKYDSQNPLHRSLLSLSQRAHELAAQGKAGEEELRQVEQEIDHKAAELWGLTEEELEEIQASLKELS